MAKKKKRFFWIQLKADFFRQKEIKKLRKIAGGDTYTIIYLKMLLLAAENDYKIYFEGVEDDFAEELALELDEDADNVKMTLAFLQRQKLIEIISEDEYLLPQCATMTGSESESAERVRRFREKKKEELKALQCNNEVTEGNKNVTLETETELETEQETELEQQQETDIKNHIEKFLKITPQEVAVIINTCKKYRKNEDIVVVVKEKWDIVTKGNFNNPIGALVQAIKEDWKQSAFNNKNNLRFNDFKQRDYDYDELESKLLGWE